MTMFSPVGGLCKQLSLHEFCRAVEPRAEESRSGGGDAHVQHDDHAAELENGIA